MYPDGTTRRHLNRSRARPRVFQLIRYLEAGDFTGVDQVWRAFRNDAEKFFCWYILTSSEKALMHAVIPDVMGWTEEVIRDDDEI